MYTIIIVLCVFLVCFLPGIVKGGEFVNFSFPVSDAGLEIDGVYQGVADYQYFVPSGNHTVKVTKADQTLSEQSISVGHPLFLTWLIHYHQDNPLPLDQVSEQAKQAVLRFDLQEIARYSTVTDYDPVSVYPPLYSNLARDMRALGIDDSDALDLAAQYIGSKEMLDEASSLQVSTPLFSAALDAAKASDGQAGLRSSNIDITGKRTTLDAGLFTQSGISYPEASFVMGDRSGDKSSAGIQVTTEPFSIATTPVTQYQWALFMQAHPEWEKSAVGDDAYLAGQNPSVLVPSSTAVTGVSAKAADAFCTWLSEITGKQVFLPSETQWSLAAMASRNRASQKDLEYVDDGSDTATGMLGTIWQLTSTPYIPLARLTDYGKVMALEERYQVSNDRIVKGGLMAGTQSGRNTVGTIRVDDASGLVGFRIAWMDR
ncbi:MAG: SUMF1/EgtB/PvdO family nonheme iron enzyme [Sphaerochaetaceae bacterium]|nr:SUMF1/EgtB/PvdO family nonheme iron enzyme [Spirochaetales bacterium]MDY5499573.1 SUMF1/EgtB/PvdO family nonheme iron enzyme [Sphaerochaetaceae bacterium]